MIEQLFSTSVVMETYKDEDFCMNKTDVDQNFKSNIVETFEKQNKNEKTLFF